VAATVNVWLPLARPVTVRGLVHGAAAPPSSVQLNVLGVSVEVNENVPDVWFDGFVGFAVIVVFGATVSMLTLIVWQPELLAESVTQITIVCAP
jgi:hypothetical protein